MFNIGTLNSISDIIYDVLDKDSYIVSDSIENADAIIVRSFVMHDLVFGENLKAIGRAGAGVNTIPVERCAEEGIVVFNTPGANANAVKEMALGSMIIAARNVLESISWTQTLKGNGAQVPKLGEKGKGQFVGHELKGMTLGVIGLGAVGALVAEAALNLGMKVLGTDPHLSMNAALTLDNRVVFTEEEDLIKRSDIISIHAPLTDETRDKYDEEFLAKTKDGVILLNFSRAEIGKASAIKSALESGKVKKYIVDFPTDEMLGVDGVVVMPHLASGSYEAEDNCAVMAATEIKDYLESGNIINSVNYPRVSLGEKQGVRIGVRYDVDMVEDMVTIVNGVGLVINAVKDGQRDNVGYCLVDAKNAPIAAIDALKAVKGVRKVYTF